MNPENHFSRPSLVVFSGLVGFVVGTLLLWLGSSLVGKLPSSSENALVRLPMIMGGDVIFLVVWFALWVAIGIMVGMRVTRHRTHVPSPAMLSERTKLHGKYSFTLIELLIVVAVIAVLATVVIMVLNPAQMLMQARDANRLSDMKTLNQALQLYSEDVGTNMGASSTLYISVPDPLATTSLGDACEGLGLSTSSLPAGWTYHCAGPDFYKKVDGTGWLPVDFETASFGSPLGALPVDPVNQTSSGLYYTYAADGDPWELTSLFESDKYASLMANDGGADPAQYEVGTDLALTPFTHGLVGWWQLDEGSGTVAYDSSGFGNNGTWYGTPTGTSGYYSPGHNQTWAGVFDGTTTEITGNNITIPTNYTIAAWAIENAQVSQAPVFSNRSSGPGTTYFGTTVNSVFLFNDGGGASGGKFSFGQWQFVAVVGTQSSIGLYLNGSSVKSQTWTGNQTNVGALEIGWDYSTGNHWSGLIQDLRIYNRALSASEIEAIYNEEK